MSANNTIFNSYPRPVTLNLPVAPVDALASPSWFTRVRTVLNTWSAAAASSRDESRLWDIAMSDPRVMAKLIQGRQCNDRDSCVAIPQSIPVAVKTSTTVTAAKAPAVQGLSVLLERVYQSRQRHLAAIVA
jgi:hypothetical protein